MEKIKIKEMTAGDEIVDVEWRDMPHRFDMGSRVERLALLMLLTDVVDYARYLRDFTYGYYGEVPEGVAEFLDRVTSELRERAAAESVTVPTVRGLAALELLHRQDSWTSAEAEAAMDLAVTLGRGLPVNPVEVVRFDPVSSWFEAADDDE